MQSPRRSQQRSYALKTGRDIASIRSAGAIVAAVHDACREAIVAGIRTADLDAIAERTIKEHGGESLFLGYGNTGAGTGFPAITCISVNEEIVHGIPGDRIIRDGDIVTVDCGVRFEGWCADAARTFLVGNVDPAWVELVDATRTLLQTAIDLIRPGVWWKEIAAVLQDQANEGGYGIIREYVGHGIGRHLHESPRVPNYVSRDIVRNDFRLEPGLVLAVEPMLTLGSGETVSLDDGWTVVTRDRQPAAHEEHTVAVTRHGSEILTDIPVSSPATG